MTSPLATHGTVSGNSKLIQSFLEVYVVIGLVRCTALYTKIYFIMMFLNVGFSYISKLITSYSITIMFTENVH